MIDIEKHIYEACDISNMLEQFLKDFKEKKEVYQKEVEKGKRFSEMLIPFWNYNDSYLASEELLFPLCSIKSTLVTERLYLLRRIKELEFEEEFAKKKWSVYEKLLQISNTSRYSFNTIRYSMYETFGDSWEQYVEPETLKFMNRLERFRSFESVSENFKNDFSNEIRRVLKDSLGEAYGNNFTVLSRLDAELEETTFLMSKVSECISNIERQLTTLNELRNDVII